MVVLLLAAAKIVVGLGTWMSTAAWRGASPNLFFAWFYLVELAVFMTASALLIVGGRTDARARSLGVIFALYGSLFVDPLLRQVMATTHDQNAIAHFLYNFEPIAFAPFYFWQFAGGFPRPLSQWASEQWLNRTAVALAIVGGVLVATGLAAGYQFTGSSATAVLVGLGGRSEDGHLWEILLAASLPAFGLIVGNFRASSEADRRRVRLFLAGLVAGVVPLMIDVLLAAISPAYRDYWHAPQRIRYVGVLLSVALQLVPITTVYAVLVNRVFDVRFFVRKALQYALARYTLFGLLAIPGLALISYVYSNRDRSIGDLLFTRWPVGWLLLITTTLTLTLVRRPLLEMVDRRFFREAYDARRILTDLLAGSRSARTLAEQAALTVTEIDRALHVETVSMLVRDTAHNSFVDPLDNLQDLNIDSQLARLIGGADTPLDLTNSDPTLDRLPITDREWLLRSQARLFVPLVAADTSMLGFLVIGDKLSEAPFSSEDRALLGAVGSSTAMALEHRLLLETPARERPASDDPDETQSGSECSACGVIDRAGLTHCQRCGGHCAPARLPAVLAGKFVVERQIGRGGMGVVYRARDRGLDRLVALKTLPRVSVSSVKRLQQEAVAMAALQDPHLAVIYGAEAWQGCPVLVLEYLAGGTLADRLLIGPISVAEVVSMGLAVSNALDTLHTAGMLHGDIKPSNIGYTATRFPKVLDFGLARLVTGISRMIPAIRSSVSTAGVPRQTSRSTILDVHETEVHLTGTAAYLSPEAISMERPAAAFDLWSLAVTLLEALTGRNPFHGSSMLDTIRRVGMSELGDPREMCADCPPALAQFLLSALSRHREERPSSARMFHDMLSKCM